MASHKWGVIGDLHLNKLSHKIPNHLNKQFRMLDKIMKRIQDEGITNVVLLGDVFDKPNVTPGLIIRLIMFFNKYKEQTFHWVVGNHDRTSKEEASIDILKTLSEIELLANVNLYDEPTRMGKTNVGFLPYPHKNPIDGTKLSFAHIERPGSKTDSGYPIKMKKGKDDWDESHTFIIGHLHTPQKIKKTYYTGTPYQLSFGEGLKKHWGIIEFDDKGPLNFKYTRVPIRNIYNLISITVKSKKDLKQVLAGDPKRDFFKLKVAADYDLPKNFLIEHPNCFAEGISNGDTTIADSIEELKNSDQEVRVHITYKLKEYLEARGFNEKQIKSAIEKVEEVAEKYAA